MLLLALVAAACGQTDGNETTSTGASTTVTTAGPAEVDAAIHVYDGSVTLNDAELPSFQTTPIRAGDEIAFREDPDGESRSHAQVSLGDEYTIELFMGASLRVVTLEPPEYGIILHGGHIKVDHTNETTSQLKVETDKSEIKTVQGGAVFTLCEPPTGMTCLLLEEGVVEMTSAGATKTYIERQDTLQTAMFLVPDMPPGDDRCVPAQEYDEWFELARVNEAGAPLGALVGLSPYCDAEETVYVVDVHGNVLWTDTVVELEAGDLLHIEGHGTVQHGTTTRFYGPDGNPAGSPTNNVPGLEGENHSALIGRIGEDGAAFLVGSELKTSVDSAGRLFLGVNDVDVDNNAGTFVAIITVNRPSGDS